MLLVNGPKIGETREILYGHRMAIPHEGSHVIYECLSELLGHVAGVVGTQVCVGADDRFAIFAHPDWPPTKLDLQSRTVSEIELAHPDANGVRAVQPIPDFIVS